MSVKGVIYMKVKKGSKILVYGDSITDAGRSFQDRNDLGKGYCLYLQEAGGKGDRHQSGRRRRPFHRSIKALRKRCLGRKTRLYYHPNRHQ